MKRRPKNAIDYRRVGYGMWEVWEFRSNGMASPVTKEPTDLTVKQTPLRFPTARDADALAVEMAQWHHHRYKVVAAGCG